MMSSLHHHKQHQHMPVNNKKIYLHNSCYRECMEHQHCKVKRFHLGDYCLSNMFYIDSK